MQHAQLHWVGPGVGAGVYVKAAFTKQTQYLHLDCLYLDDLRCGPIEIMPPPLIQPFNHLIQNYIECLIYARS